MKDQEARKDIQKLKEEMQKLRSQTRSQLITLLDQLKLKRMFYFDGDLIIFKAKEWFEEHPTREYVNSIDQKLDDLTKVLGYKFEDVDLDVKHVLRKIDFKEK